MTAKSLEPDLQRQLSQVRQAAERAATLTRQLLAFSRRQVLQTKVVDLNQNISSLTGMLARLINANIELRFVPGHGLGYVRIDPNQIEQVLMNLAVNARDAMPDGGRLTIETANARIVSSGSGPDAGDYVSITVRDTGHGMDPETQARIFEPFFTTKPAGKGTGLGLSMAYGVVKQSGGHIKVESAPGRGSAFVIYLPRVEAPEPANHCNSTTATRGGSETILVAEDDDTVRELVSGHLSSLGYRVLTAADGLAALKAARSHHGAIDLLLTDLIMPRAGGRELAVQWRRERPAVKVIFVSGYAGHRTAARDLEIPDAWFLPKPFSLDLLAKTVRGALDSHAIGRTVV